MEPQAAARPREVRGGREDSRGSGLEQGPQRVQIDVARVTEHGLQREVTDDVVDQTEQCLRNIAWALEQAGSSWRDVVRVTYVLPDASEFPRCWPALRRCFGEVRPAAMMLSAGLADPRMKIEIEVTARRQSAAAHG